MPQRRSHHAHDDDGHAPEASRRLDPELAEDLGAQLEAGLSVRAELEAARAEADRNLAAAQRWQAEFENYKRRQERDSIEMRVRASERIVEALFPVIDDLDRAIEHTVASAASGSELKHLLTGVEMVRTRILTVFANEGVTVIDPFGDAFDPHLHQAVSERVDPELPEHTVVEVFQKGFVLGGRVLRPATVVVSTGGPAVSAQA
jgi:molecular chaperone GrpE